MKLIERMRANTEKRYRAECKRMGAELKDVEVYKQHKRNEWGEIFVIIMFILMFAVIIFLSQDFNINFNMDDETADVLNKMTDAQVQMYSPDATYSDGCIDMFNKIAGENHEVVYAIDGITRQDCQTMEAQK